MILRDMLKIKIVPKGFPSEAALVENIVGQCRGKKTAMLTGNYALWEGPNIEKGDNRLLGKSMLLTIQLCAKVWHSCIQAGTKPPTIFLLPNDLLPGTFESNEHERRFKANYQVPEEILFVLHSFGLDTEPVHYYLRDFNLDERTVRMHMQLLKRRISGGTEPLVVTFESFLQNQAACAISRGRLIHRSEIQSTPIGKQILTPAQIFDSFSGGPDLSPVAVRLTHPNGAPFCSLIAATFMHNLELFGFEQAINTFVSEEYPCVDKAAAAYRYMYGGKMAIRNIYLDGEFVVMDSQLR
jgi:hypothetical protein